MSLENEVPGYTIEKAGFTFAQLGVDSFAMIELRVAIGVDFESSLSRASDGVLMAFLVTRKVVARG